jgi:hypothetical protein
VSWSDDWRGRLRRLDALTALALPTLGVAVYALVRALHWPMVHDASILNYIGWRISEGDVPYRDLFDMNMPGTYAFHALLALAPGSWDTRTGVANVLAVAAASGLSWFWAARVSGRRSSGMFAAAACVFFCLSFGSWNVLQRDLLLMIPAMAGLIVASSAVRPSLWRLAVAGVCFGLASSVKPQALLIGSAYWCAVVLNPEAWREARPQLGRRLGAMVLGVAVAWAPLLAWLAVKGGIGEFVRTILPFNAGVYAQIDAGVLQRSNKSLLKLFVFPELLRITGERVLRLVFLSAAVYNLAFDRTSVARLTAGLAALAGAALFLLQLKGWWYHLFPCYVLGSVVLGDLMGELQPPEGPRRPGVVLKVAIVAALATTAHSSLMAVNPTPLASDSRETRTAGLVETLRPLVVGGKTLQILDTGQGGAEVLLRLQLKLPTSMLYEYPLFLSALGPSFDREPVRRLNERFLTELVSARPDYLLIFRDGWPRGGFDRLQWNDRLHRFVEDNYRVIQEHPGYRVMARN